MVYHEYFVEGGWREGMAWHGMAWHLVMRYFEILGRARDGDFLSNCCLLGLSMGGLLLGHFFAGRNFFFLFPLCGLVGIYFYYIFLFDDSYATTTTEAFICFGARAYAYVCF